MEPKRISGVLLLVVPVLLLAQINWTKHTISDSCSGAGSVCAADFDGDGRIDVAGTALEANRICWWHNDGFGRIGWTEHVVDSAFAGAIFVHAADIDGDRHADILGCAWFGHEVAWWRNDGGSPIRWVKQTIDGDFTSAHEACGADMDGDGDLDVVGASAGRGEIAWWRNEGGAPIRWVKQVIDNNFSGARSVRTADLNHDGRPDVVGAALPGNLIAAWYNSNDSTWIRQTIDNNLPSAHMVELSDIDRDADIDIAGVGYGSSTVFWWRNDGGMPAQWTKLAVGSNFRGGLGIHAADLNGDRIIDLLATSDYLDDLAWWQNSGTDPIVWTKQLIDSSFDGAWPVFAADVDKDGKVDVLSGAYYGNQVAWFDNEPVRIREEHAVSVNRRGGSASIIRGRMRLPRGQEARVYDIAGKTVMPGTVNPGVYFIAIDGATIQKVVSVR